MKRLLLILFAIFLITSPVQGEFFKDVIVTSPTGIWTDSRAYTTLNAAVTAIGASEQDLYIAKEEIVTTLVIPANIRLHFLKDGAIANSNTLTINTKSIHADHQIFTGVGAVNFASGTEVRSRWFEDFETSITQTSNDTVTLLVDTTDTLANSAAVGDNVLLKWNTYSPITISAGQTLSNIGDISASGIRLFVVSGSVAFKTPSPLKEIRADWFGNTLAALDVADNAATTAGKLLVIPPGDWVIDDNLTLSSSLKILPNVDLQIATTKTLTINGTFDVGRYKIFSCTGTGKAVFESGKIKEVYPEWWGENTVPGTTDMASKIQAAIDARPTWGSSVNFPIVSLAATKYLVNSAIDLSQSEVTGTMQHDNIHIKGAGVSNTWIIGNTGNLIIDTCGSDGINLEGIYITSAVVGLATPSTTGILQAKLTTSTSCQFHVYDNIAVVMHDDTVANMAQGTFAIANCQAESAVYSNVFLQANLPFIGTITSGYLYGVDSVYQAGDIDPVIASMGNIKFVGHNKLWTVNRRSSAMLLSNVVDLDFAGEITNTGAGGANDVAVYVLGVCYNFNFKGIVEALGTVFKVNEGFYGVNANIESANPLNTAAPLISVTSDTGFIENGDLKFTLNTSLTRNLITLTAATTNKGFINTRIKTNQLKANAIDTLSATFVNYSTHKSLFIEAADGMLNTNTRMLDWSSEAIVAASEAVAGFNGALSEKVVYYHLDGDEVTVKFYLTGTASADTFFRFILPFAPNAVMPFQYALIPQVTDNALRLTAPGLIKLTAGSTTAELYSTVASGAWTGAAVKGAYGTIKYYRDPNYPG